MNNQCQHFRVCVVVYVSVTQYLPWSYWLYVYSYYSTGVISKGWEGGGNPLPLGSK